MDGPSRFAFPPHSCWRTLNVGNPPPQRRTEYMLVVSTSVATAAIDTAAAPVSSAHSHFSLSLVFSMLIQCGHGCLLELRTLAIFLLVVFLWPPSSSVICRHFISCPTANRWLLKLSGLALALSGATHARALSGSLMSPLAGGPPHGPSI